MARDIEFRSYDPIKKKMYYDFDQSITEIKIGQSIHNFVYHVGLWNGTLMQYTGLKDKNGNKIFEGDILLSDRGEYTKVTDYNQFIHDVLYSEDHSGIGGFTQKELLIIGNIYENPELLNT